MFMSILCFVFLFRSLSSVYPDRLAVLLPFICSPKAPFTVVPPLAQSGGCPLNPAEQVDDESVSTLLCKETDTVPHSYGTSGWKHNGLFPDGWKIGPPFVFGKPHRVAADMCFNLTNGFTDL